MVGVNGQGVVAFDGVDSHLLSGAPAKTNLLITIKESSDIPIHDYLKKCVKSQRYLIRENLSWQRSKRKFIWQISQIDFSNLIQISQIENFK